jgi:hypothetical protein
VPGGAITAKLMEMPQLWICRWGEGPPRAKGAREPRLSDSRDSPTRDQPYQPEQAGRAAADDPGYGASPFSSPRCCAGSFLRAPPPSVSRPLSLRKAHKCDPQALPEIKSGAAAVPALGTNRILAKFYDLHSAGRRYHTSRVPYLQLSPCVICPLEGDSRRGSLGRRRGGDSEVSAEAGLVGGAAGARPLGQAERRKRRTRRILAATAKEVSPRRRRSLLCVEHPRWQLQYP